MRNDPRWGSNGSPAGESAGPGEPLDDELSRLTAEVEGLRRALETRPLIDLAKGMVMHRYSCGDAAAFGLLRRFSQEYNVKIRDLAAAVVARVDGDRHDDGVRADVVHIAGRLFDGQVDGAGPPAHERPSSVDPPR